MNKKDFFKHYRGFGSKDDIIEELYNLAVYAKSLEKNLENIDVAIKMLIEIVPIGSDEMLDAFYQRIDIIRQEIK